MKVYREVIEKLLLALAEEEETFRKKATGQVVNQDESVWPPWPWPPWGDDDDGDDDDKPTNKTEDAHKLAKKVVKFEKRLADASLSPELLDLDPIGTYNPAPLANLTDVLPQIHFPEYFSTFTPRAFPERVILTHPPFANSLADILNSTSSDVIEAYLVIRASLSLSPYLGASTKAWQAQRTLVETLSGIKKGAVGDRGEYCLGQVEQTLGFASGRFFVNETFGGESREKATKVITGKKCHTLCVRD